MEGYQKAANIKRIYQYLITEARVRADNAYWRGDGETVGHYNALIWKLQDRSKRERWRVIEGE